MDDTDLTLNLSLTFTGTYSDKKKQKVFGNLAQRIRQRKALRREQDVDPPAEGASAPSHRKRHAPGDDDDDNSAPSPSPGGILKRARRDGPPSGGTTQGPRKTDNGVISSLFRHNPDIPAVKSQSVKTVKEEMFGSTKFTDLPLHPHLVSVVEDRLGLTTMTRVQQLSIPVILQERDVLIKSQTGSGKTLAYAVPLVHTLASLPRKTNRSVGPLALIIVPTRELAIQSYETINKLLQSAVWIVAGCLMGGEKRKTEKARIRKGLNVLVCTPGRLLDHLKHTSCLSLARVRWLIIDEADRLLELGYEKDVAQIVSVLREQSQERRQTILLSATLSAGVERLSGMTLNDHCSIDASLHPPPESANQQPGLSAAANQRPGEEGSDSTFALPTKLTQYFTVVPCKLRLVSLAAFLLCKSQLQTRQSKMVVFLSTQDSVEFHYHLFQQVLCPPSLHHDNDSDDDDDDEGGGGMKGRVVDLFKLHGDMAQKERTRVFQEFAAAPTGVLLCTDVASRGLHLSGVDWIVQYCTPGAGVDYVHRVGRTARAGRQGNALLFLMPGETDYLRELNTMHISLREMSMKEILITLLSAIPGLPHLHINNKRPMPRTYEEAATFLQDRCEERVLRNMSLKNLAIKGYQSFVRAYATYPSHLKDIFSVKDLHLGHVAKSFALRESPSNLQGQRSKGKGRRAEGNQRFKLKGNMRSMDKPKKKRPLSATVSEFGSGFVASKGVSTKHHKSNKKSLFG
ncbi:hypothetical protein ACOMHN_055911 [Nucella lapillus]